MENMPALDPFWLEDVTSQQVSRIPTTQSPYPMNMSTASSQDIYNSTKTSSTATDTPVGREFSLTALWVYLAARIISGVLAVFGNSLTLFAVCKFERLQTCTNYLICSLAVSDLLAGVMVPLIPVHELHSSSQFFIPVCLTQQTFALTAASGNLLNILYLSIDRYIYIAFPLRYHGFVTPQRVVIILTITWVTFLVAAPTIISTDNHLQVGMPCRYHTFLKEAVQLILIFPMLIVVLTITLHLAIAKIAYKQARQIQAEQLPYNTLAVAINQSTRQISRTLAMVLGFYVFSLIPSVILGGFTYENSTLESYHRYAIALFWANSWVNPLIYAWRLKDFKIAFKKIFTGTGSFIEVPGIGP